MYSKLQVSQWNKRIIDRLRSRNRRNLNHKLQNWDTWKLFITKHWILNLNLRNCTTINVLRSQRSSDNSLTRPKQEVSDNCVRHWVVREFCSPDTTSHEEQITVFTFLDSYTTKIYLYYSLLLSKFIILIRFKTYKPNHRDRYKDKLQFRII